MKDLRILHSIIIPVYNAVPYLNKCVDSILSQTIKDWELILVDDGSTDDSGIICDEYASKDLRIRVFHQPNGGPSKARNLGIENAIGEWISFIDADDWVDPFYLEYFEKQDKKADINFFSLTKYFIDGGTLTFNPHKGYYQGKSAIEEAIYYLKYNNGFGDIFGWTVDKFIRRSVVEENRVRFVEGLVFREDEIFTSHVCQNVESLQILDRPLYFYRIINTGITAKGLSCSDYELLTNYIEQISNTYENTRLIELDLYRVANYHIDLLKRTYKLSRPIKSIRRLHEYLHRHSEIANKMKSDPVAFRMRFPIGISSLLYLFYWLNTNGLDQLRVYLGLGRFIKFK